MTGFNSIQYAGLDNVYLTSQILLCLISGYKIYLVKFVYKLLLKTSDAIGILIVQAMAQIDFTFTQKLTTVIPVPERVTCCFTSVGISGAYLLSKCLQIVCTTTSV